MGGHFLSGRFFIWLCSGLGGEKGESCPERIEYVRFIERYIRGGGRGGELMYMRMAVGGR